jgi:hypothetical protein
MNTQNFPTSLVIRLLVLVTLQGTPVAAQSTSQPQADPASSSTRNYKGTVTDLTAGSGIVLTPNPITTSGVVAIDPTVIPQTEHAERRQHDHQRQPDGGLPRSRLARAGWLHHSSGDERKSRGDG